MSAFPPIRTQEGIAVSADTALAYLSSYLQSTQTHPHLLPNARLEASGPTAGSSKSSVIIHNLQRVEAGLKGEWLAPVLDLEESVPVATGGDAMEQDAAQTEGEDWVDIDQYQREQSVEGPGEAREDLAVEDGGDVEENVDLEYGEEINGNVVMGEPQTSIKPLKRASNTDSKVKKAVNPEQRKKDKKARMKAEKKAKEEERKKASHDA